MTRDIQTWLMSATSYADGDAFVGVRVGRGGGIRTRNLVLPKHVRCRCATPRRPSRIDGDARRSSATVMPMIRPTRNRRAGRYAIGLCSSAPTTVCGATPVEPKGGAPACVEDLLSSL